MNSKQDGTGAPMQIEQLEWWAEVLKTPQNIYPVRNFFSGNNVTFLRKITELSFSQDNVPRKITPIR